MGGQSPTPSRAALKGHPIHPMLIPLPIGLLTAVAVTDIGYWIDGGRGWALASAWLLAAMVLAGTLAGAAGLTDYLSVQKIREHSVSKKHGIGNGVILTLMLVNLLIRLPDAEAAVLPWGLVLTLVGLAGISYTGWLGGEMSYKHMFGVNPDQLSPDSPLFGSKARQ